MSLLEFSCRLRYGSGFEVNASFTSDARVTALCGPSGSGKTSILSLIAGLRRPDEGRIALAGRVLFDGASGVNISPDKRRIGYVFQGHLLFPHLSVRDNLVYGWKRRRVHGDLKEFHHLVEVLELGQLLERMPDTLSGGERQRVALGRALLCGPELLLLDEPVASIDPDLKGRVLAYVQRVLDEWRVPAVYVSHDPNEVRRMAERIVEIRGGRVHAQYAAPEPPGVAATS